MHGDMLVRVESMLEMWSWSITKRKKKFLPFQHEVLNQSEYEKLNVEWTQSKETDDHNKLR